MNWGVTPPGDSLMKKIVLVIDHKERDLRGIVLVAYWLNHKHGIVPYITNTKNEISCLIKHRPHLIMVQHVRHLHQREFIHYAKRQKTNIALGLAEGFPLSEDQFLFSAGRDEFLPYVDLLLPWGKIYNKYVHNNPIVKGTPSVPVGSPRFDYHTSRYRT